MKRLLLSIIILGAAAVVWIPGKSLIRAAEEKLVPHEGVMEPTNVLMNAIAKHMSNILTGILVGSFKYVEQEAGAVVDQSYKIDETFFSEDPRENKWFERANINPDDAATIDKLRKEFNSYVKEVVSSALKVQKGASAMDQKAAFSAFTEMVEKTCFKCHEKIRDVKYIEHHYVYPE